MNELNETKNVVRYVIRKSHPDNFPYIKEIGRSDSYVANINSAARFSLEDVIRLTNSNPDKWIVIEETCSYKEVTVKIVVEPINPEIISLIKEREDLK